jgi:hypothetical protein
MSERVVFYQLTHKFVNQNEAIPEDARQVIYYSLAIGHHVGVMDCFGNMMEIPLDDYRDWICALPEGAARHKLEGLLRWGEIEINSGHANDLLPVLTGGLPQMDERQAQWARTLISCLENMKIEPALYLMARKRA